METGSATVVFDPATLQDRVRALTDEYFTRMQAPDPRFWNRYKDLQRGTPVTLQFGADIETPVLTAPLAGRNVADLIKTIGDDEFAEIELAPHIRVSAQGQSHYPLYDTEGNPWNFANVARPRPDPRVDRLLDTIAWDPVARPLLWRGVSWQGQCNPSYEESTVEIRLLPQPGQGIRGALETLKTRTAEIADELALSFDMPAGHWHISLHQGDANVGGLYAKPSALGIDYTIALWRMLDEAPALFTDYGVAETDAMTCRHWFLPGIFSGGIRQNVAVLRGGDAAIRWPHGVRPEFTVEATANIDNDWSLLFYSAALRYLTDGGTFRPRKYAAELTQAAHGMRMAVRVDKPEDSYLNGKAAEAGEDTIPGAAFEMLRAWDADKRGIGSMDPQGRFVPDAVSGHPLGLAFARMAQVTLTERGGARIEFNQLKTPGDPLRFTGHLEMQMTGGFADTYPKRLTRGAGGYLHMLDETYDAIKAGKPITKMVPPEMLVEMLLVRAQGYREYLQESLSPRFAAARAESGVDVDFLLGATDLFIRQVCTDNGIDPATLSKNRVTAAAKGARIAPDA